MRLFEKLNTPVAVAIVLVLALVVDGCLFYQYDLQLQSARSATVLSPIFRTDLDTAAEEITLSSPEQANDRQQDSLTATSLLIALLIIGVINVAVTFLTLLSARRHQRAETYARYLDEEGQPLKRAAWGSEAQPQVHKLEQQVLKLERQVPKLQQEVLKLQQDYKQLAEELARVRTLHKEAEQDRERIMLEGLQNIERVLRRKVAAPSQEENRPKRPLRAKEESGD